MMCADVVCQEAAVATTTLSVSGVSSPENVKEGKCADRKTASLLVSSGKRPSSTMYVDLVDLSR